MIESSCGFDCSKCPLYLITIEKDEALRKLIEDKYKIKKGMDCLGCLSDKCAVICDKCKIKDCCKEKNIRNCAWCDSFNDCKEIQYILNTNLQSKEYLEEENKKYQEAKLCKKY